MGAALIYTHLAVALVGAAIAFGGAWKVQDWRYTTQISTLKAQHAADYAKAQQRALDETTRLQAQKDKATKDAAKRALKLEADLATARLIGDGLRDDLAASRLQLSEASRSSLNQYASTLSVVLAECVRSLESMAGKADGHAADARTLIEAWPK